VLFSGFQQKYGEIEKIGKSKNSLSGFVLIGSIVCKLREKGLTILNTQWDCWFCRRI
jgi:hypothetical protein